jgi:hypothetical protein
MKRLTISSCLLACWGGVSCAFAATPLPIDRPTPPPCAADGTCYPNKGSFGWYQCRWRKWPGEELQPTPAGVQPTPAEVQKGTDLNPFEAPSAEHEDTQAPPSTKKTESSSTTTPEGESTAPSEGAETPRSVPNAGSPPTAPPRPPQSGPAPSRGYQAPSYQSPYKPVPTSPNSTRQPTSDADPPPTLPWQAAASARRPAVADVSPSGTRPAAPRASQRSGGDDPPPAVPSVFHSAAL